MSVWGFLMKHKGGEIMYWSSSWIALAASVFVLLLIYIRQMGD